MDTDQLKCKWVRFKAALKTRWTRFRDEHLVQSEGGYDKVVYKAHERYGDKKGRAHEGGRPAVSAVGAGRRWGNVPLRIDAIHE
jgi:uncharacterized protein YjbJ (UPF0337 family)